MSTFCINKQHIYESAEISSVPACSNFSCDSPFTHHRTRGSSETCGQSAEIEEKQRLYVDDQVENGSSSELDPLRVLADHKTLFLRISAATGVDVDDVRHHAFELAMAANSRKKGIGWVVRALARIARHDGRSSGFDSLTDCEVALHVADPQTLSPEALLIQAEEAAIRQRQLEDFGESVKSVIDAVSAGNRGLADRLGVTERRARQITEQLVRTIELAQNNDEIDEVLSQLARRINAKNIIGSGRRGVSQ